MVKLTKRIMIVEDELLIQMVNKQMIENAGYTVCCTASSGSEAVQLALSAAPNLILMDIKLEGEMDGITATDEMLKRTQIPVIYLSGNSDDATLHRIRNSRILGFFVKPVDYSQLLKQIDEHFERMA